MSLTPIGTPLPQDLQDRGHRVLETLHGLRLEQQLNRACRTVLGVLIGCRPAPSAPTEEREAFKVLCDEVQVWLKEEIAEMRRRKPRAKRATGKATPPRRVGHA